MKTPTGYQFALFRILFGLYLALHFGMLIPYGGELFSSAGTLGDASLNFTYPVFPNVLYVLDQPWQVSAFLGAMVGCSLALSLGYRRRLVAVLLWYGWACLFNRNNLISNPGLPFIGWLLLATALIPRGEGLSVSQGRPDPGWRLPPILYAGAWLIMGLGYSISGIHKLSSPSWADGTALHYLLVNPLARDYWLRDVMVALPLPMIKVLTYSVLALECGFILLCLTRKARLFGWLAMVGMHIGIVMVVDFADLTFGMLMVHLFTFDPSWIPARALGGERMVVFFDGVCGLCDRFVSFLLDEDDARILRFATLQGPVAERELSPELRSHLKTVVLKVGGETYVKTDAVWRILVSLGGLWWVIGRALSIVPRPLRDFGYDLVAKNRYRLFGQSPSCRMPTPEERAVFLG